MSDNASSSTKRMRVPSVLVDCCECSATFEVDARSFDLAVKVGDGRFRCDECKQDTESEHTGATNE